MNLNIQNLDTLPQTLQLPLIFTYLPSLNSLLLASMPVEQEKPNAKKKLNFKGGANTATITTTLPAFLFSLKQKTWQPLETKGRFPSRREGAGVVVGENGLMVYGGRECSGAGRALNDLYCLEVGRSWNWRKLFTMEGPPPCGSPVVCGLGDGGLLVIVGEIWVFDGRGVSWQSEKADLPGGHWQRVGMDSVPFGIGAGSGQGREVIVFGGEEGEQLKGAVVEAQQGRVRQIQVTASGQVSAVGLQTCTTSAGRGLLFGGVIFGSYLSEEEKVYIEHLQQIKEPIKQLALVETEEERSNWAITSHRGLVRVQIYQDQFQEAADHVDTQGVLSHREEEEGEEGIEQSPETARHVSVVPSATQPPLASPQRPLHSPPQLPFLQHLQPLLAGQSRKRQILEEKGWLLQGAIKKAESMVLSLCRYGTQEDKRRHIARVKQMRATLEEIFKRQSFLRQRRDEHQMGGTQFEETFP